MAVGAGDSAKHAAAAKIGDEGPRQRSAASRAIARTAKVLSLDWNQHSVNGFCKKFGDDRAIKNLDRSQLQKEYPMLCFCSARDPKGACCWRTQGHDGRVPTLMKFIWAFPTFGWFALKYLKVGWMHKFYVDDFPKASLGTIAFASVLSVLADAFTDPKMATWTDTLRSRYGRRKPFICASAIFVPIVFIFAWLPGLVGGGMPASIWYGFWHICFKLADTLFLIPHDAWGAQLSPLYSEKTNIWQWKVILRSLGILFGMAVAPIIFVSDDCTSTPDSGCTELPGIAVFFAGLFSASCMVLVWFGKEGEYESVAASAPVGRWDFSDQDTIPMLMTTFLNQPFRILLIGDIVKALGTEIPFVVLPFVASWVLGEKCWETSKIFGIMVVIGLVSGLFSVPAWTKLTQKTNKFTAYIGFHVAQIVACVCVAFVDFDTGDCVYSWVALVMLAIFGIATGGSFLLFDLISDVVDYDELLTGGARREASYLMSVEFIPKFVSIPGESLPFLLLAYLGYTRPLANPDASGAACSVDAVCHQLFTNSTLGASRCEESGGCAELVANGVQFICNNALGTCGIKQNDSVRWTLRICAAIFPGLCLLAGTAALLWYPKAARDEATHEQLLLAIARLRRGEVVEDPWRPGNFIHPIEQLSIALAGPLSYLMPSELKRVAEAPAVEGDVADFRAVIRMTGLHALACALLIPLGIWGVAAGWEEMSDDLGASVSPMGLMSIGIGLVSVWFSSSRLAAMLKLKSLRVTRRDVIVMYNRSCPFTGDARLVDI